MSKKRPPNVTFLKAVSKLIAGCESEEEAKEKLGQFLAGTGSKKQGALDPPTAPRKKKPKGKNKNKKDDEREAKHYQKPKHFTWVDGEYWAHLMKDTNSYPTRWHYWHTYDDGRVVENSVHTMRHGEAQDLLTLACENPNTPVKFGGQSVEVGSESISDILMKKHRERHKQTANLPYATTSDSDDEGQQEDAGEESGPATARERSSESHAAPTPTDASDSTGPGDGEAEDTGGSGGETPGNEPDSQGEENRESTGNTDRQAAPEEQEEEKAQPGAAGGEQQQQS